MNFKVKDRNSFPPGGWIFRQPETGWTAPMPMSDSFNATVDKIIKHREANPVHNLPTARAEVERELENFTAMRFNYDPKIVLGDDEEAKKKRQRRPSFLTRLASGAGRAVERLRKDIDGARILAEWLGENMEPVAPELSEWRAEQCAICPHNSPRKGKMERMVAEAIREHENAKKTAALETPLDAKLNTCSLCNCHLKLKVHVPLKHIDSIQNKVSFPENCWITKERNEPAGDAPVIKYDPRTEIVDFYRWHKDSIPKKEKPSFHINTTLTNVAQGLGDCVMLTDILRFEGTSAYSNSKHFGPLMEFNPHYKYRINSPFLVDAPMLVRAFDCGGGHFLQRIRRAYKCPVDLKPKGLIVCDVQKPKREMVVMHFDPGVHAQWQQQHIHPRARVLYSESRKIIETIIKERPDLDFVTIGNDPMIAGARHVKTDTTQDAIRLIAGASWFVGIMSGPMHVATALGLRCIVIINFPDARKIYLPTILDIQQVEAEWFYPQNVHLHQDNDSRLVPKLSEYTLRAAFDGDVYPYWSDEYLSLVEEKI